MSEHSATDVRPDEKVRSGGSPTRILLTTDGSKGSELAAGTAAELSRKFGSSLYLAHIMPVSSFHSSFGPDDGPGDGDTLTIYGEDANHARDLLDRQTRRLEDEGVAVEKAHHVAGEPDVEVVALAEKVGADLVVVGSRGAGAFKRAPMGGVSESIVRHAHCPVLVVREQESKGDGRQA